jgi:hypothetical protein
VRSDVTYDGETPDGVFQSRVRTQSWRSDDYVRALYSLRYDVRESIDAPARVAFFQLGADQYNVPFQHIARGSAAGLGEQWDTAALPEGYSRRGALLDGAMPWIGLYDIDPVQWASLGEQAYGARANKAMIVRAWKARLNGRDIPAPHYSVYSTCEAAYRGKPGFESGRKDAQVELSPPDGLQRFMKGDFVEAEVEVLILPQQRSDYYGPNTLLAEAMESQSACWTLTHREAAGTQVYVAAGTGIVEQTWPVRVRVNKGTEARFTITGGIGYTPVTLCGVSNYRDFTLDRIREDGSRERVDQSTFIGNDWWQARYLPQAGEWELDFTLPLDTSTSSNTFLWSTSNRTTP